MSGELVGRDARVLALLSVRLPGPKGEAAAPLGVAEWCRIGGRLRQAGLSRPGELLAVGPRFWPAVGLADEDVVRLRGLLDRGDALDRELERLARLGVRPGTGAGAGHPAGLRAGLRGPA